jgi:fatty acid/phospholipid biosynthesis enzyme
MKKASMISAGGTAAVLYYSRLHGNGKSPIFRRQAVTTVMPTPDANVVEQTSFCAKAKSTASHDACWYNAAR